MLLITFTHFVDLFKCIIWSYKNERRKKKEEKNEERRKDIYSSRCPFFSNLPLLFLWPKDRLVASSSFLQDFKRGFQQKISHIPGKEWPGKTR